VVDTTPADVDCPEVNDLPGPIDWSEFIVIHCSTIRVAEHLHIFILAVVIPVDVETCDPLVKFIFGEIILGKHIFDLVCLHD
jgi:hypothetical protein